MDVSSLQLSNMSLQQILIFNPANSDFQIPNINTELISLFTLATTQNRTLDQSEQIQHTLNAYSKILQPELWAQWIRNQVEKFDAGSITNCQTFMNEAVLKYNKIISETGKFSGSQTTVQEDIIAMFSKHSNQPPQHSKNAKRKTEDTNIDEDSTKKIGKYSKTNNGVPPFLKETESVINGVKTKFKLGNTRIWKNKTYHYCDCTKHRNCMHWHTHKPADCRTRLKWIRELRDDTHANIADNENHEQTRDEVEDPSYAKRQIQTLLASALNMTKENEVVHDAITDALNALI